MKDIRIGKPFDIGLLQPQGGVVTHLSNVCQAFAFLNDVSMQMLWTACNPSQRPHRYGTAETGIRLQDVGGGWGGGGGGGGGAGGSGRMPGSLR